MVRIHLRTAAEIFGWVAAAGFAGAVGERLAGTLCAEPVLAAQKKTRPMRERNTLPVWQNSISGK
jgi:hypothetical protein